jgi:2-succinyl-5-enolpyruvyl-6-hydroxy-3-cyclohexene-1-carboxylate synthase
MYNISKNAQITIALLKAHNIRQIVINPGTTNMPIICSVQNDPFFTCYSVVDERSAMYFAIGLHLQTGERIAICCTSAQATRNYIPGLTEAFYKHTPILAITTSKLPSQVGQEYMQGPNQTSLPIDAVKKTFACPYVSNKNDEIHCSRLINEAILELTHRTPGPVQLNLPMDDAELGVYEVPELPSVKVIHRYMAWDNWTVSLKDKKIMLVIGEHRPFTEKQQAVIEAFCESHNVFVYTNHLSNYHGKYSLNANLLLATIGSDFAKNNPDVLLTIGGQTGDYAIFGKLAAGQYTDFEHWRISPEGDIVDTYNKLTKVFECPEDLFFERLATNEKSEHSYYEQWVELQNTKHIPEELPFSNTYLAQQLHKDLPKNSYLNLAILNSLRNWSFFQFDASIKVYANVAAFGIDGCTSMFIGESVATEELCFLITGDLAFFYDMNALGIRHIKNNVRILLVNNRCGTEFKHYNHPNFQFGKAGDPYVAAVGHNGSAKGWAEDAGFNYLKASNKEEFLQYKHKFLGASEKPIVFEVFTNPEDESEALAMVMNANKNTIDTIKSKIKSVIGDDGVKIIKKLVKK